MKQKPTIHPLNFILFVWIVKCHLPGRTCRGTFSFRVVRGVHPWVTGWMVRFCRFSCIWSLELDICMMIVSRFMWKNLMNIYLINPPFRERVCCYSVSFGLSECLHSSFTSCFPFDSMTAIRFLSRERRRWTTKTGKLCVLPDVSVQKSTNQEEDNQFT